MKSIATLIALLLTTTLFAQRVQWASRVVKYSTQYEDYFYAARQVLGPPNAMDNVKDSPFSWAPKSDDNFNNEHIHVEFEEPMYVQQFAIAESLNPGSIYQVYLYDTKGKRHKVYEQESVRPVYSYTRLFTKKIPKTSYKVKGLKLVMRTKSIKGRNQIDAIGISDSRKRFKTPVDTLKYSESVEMPENLGIAVNSPYSERLPIISPDGKVLYFTRKYHPENIPDQSEKNPMEKFKDDIWVSYRLPNGGWSQAKNVGTPLNNDSHNFVVAVSPGNDRLYVSSAYKRSEKDGVAISKKVYGEWAKPSALRIAKMYNHNPFAGYHLTPDGNILLLAIERDDSYGDRDLYVSFKKKDGTWTEPRNLGEDVNSIGMESSIFIAADYKTIYFASGGHAGYGGLDMFISRRMDDSWTNWSKPKNLGSRINTPGNDFNYTIPASGEYAYFSSDFRSYGQSDLFRIRLPKEAQPEPVQLVTGRMIDSETNKPIDNQTYQVIVSKDKTPTIDGYFAVTDDGDVEEYLEDLDGEPAANNSSPEVEELQEQVDRLNKDISKIQKKREQPEPDYNEPDYNEPDYNEPDIDENPPSHTEKVRKEDPELARLREKYNQSIRDKPSRPTASKSKKRTTSRPFNSSRTKPRKKKTKKPKKKRTVSRPRNTSRSKTKTTAKTEPKTTASAPVDPNESEVDRLKRLYNKAYNKKATPKKTTPKVEEPEPAEKPEANNEPAPEENEWDENDPFSENPNEETTETEPVAQPNFEEVTEQVRADLEKEMRNEVKKELQEELMSEVKRELEKELEADVKTKLKDDLRQNVEKKLRKDLQKQLKDELKEDVATDLRKDMKDDIEKELRKNLRDDVRNDLRNNMKDQVKDELKSEMEYRLKKELEGQIRKELEAKIRKQVRSEVEQEIAAKRKAEAEKEEAYEEVEKDILLIPLKVGQIIPMKNIFFAANEFSIKQVSNKELNRIMGFLNANDKLVVEVGGHTNGLCSHEFANELSKGRAEKVAEWFVANGVPRHRIQFRGYGKLQPIATNDTVTGRKKNQRVELKILEILD